MDLEVAAVIGDPAYTTDPLAKLLLTLGALVAFVALCMAFSVDERDQTDEDDHD